MIDPSIKEREKADENFRRLIRFASLLRLVGGGSSDNAFLSIDFATGNNIALVNGSGGAIGVAQKLDNTFQSFAGGVLRKTDRGALVEPASTNVIAQSDTNAWGTSATFLAVNSKISVFPGGSAWEYVADGSAGLKSRTSIGNFSASREALSIIIETTPTTVGFQFYIQDVTNANAAAFLIDVANVAGNWFGAGNATSQTYGQVKLGPGPNGGTLYRFVLTGIPVTAGNVRKCLLFPNRTPTSGNSIIIHHPQHEVNNFATSPILNPTTSPVTRAAETITVAVPNGTYDVRYITKDGVLNSNRLGVVASGGLLTLATDIPESAKIVQSQDLASLRNGYITSISIWNPSLAIHVLGDSFPTQFGLLQYLPTQLYKPTTWTFDGVGGTSLVQEATRFDGTPSFYGDILIILDGGLSDSLVQATGAIDSMVAHLTTNPKKWLYIESGPDTATQGAIGSGPYTTWLNTTHGINAAYPNNFVPTLSLMQSHGDGSANDISDIANGWWPRSLRKDTIHPNDLGCSYLAQIIDDAILSKRF